MMDKPDCEMTPLEYLNANKSGLPVEFVTQLRELLSKYERRHNENVTHAAYIRGFKAGVKHAKSFKRKPE